MELTLSRQEKVSLLGQKLSEHFAQQLAETRVKNDKSMPEAERSTLLAKISVYKSLGRIFSPDETAPNDDE